MVIFFNPKGRRGLCVGYAKKLLCDGAGNCRRRSGGRVLLLYAGGRGAAQP